MTRQCPQCQCYFPNRVFYLRKQEVNSAGFIVSVAYHHRVDHNGSYRCRAVESSTTYTCELCEYQSDHIGFQAHWTSAHNGGGGSSSQYKKRRRMEGRRPSTAADAAASSSSSPITSSSSSSAEEDNPQPMPPPDCEEDKVLLLVPTPDDNDLKCPISMELMVDPVVCDDGVTYDRFHVIRGFCDGPGYGAPRAKRIRGAKGVDFHRVLFDNDIVRRVIDSLHPEIVTLRSVERQRLKERVVQLLQQGQVQEARKYYDFVCHYDNDPMLSRIFESFDHVNQLIQIARSLPSVQLRRELHGTVHNYFMKGSAALLKGEEED